MADDRALAILHLSDLHYESPDSNYGDEDKAQVPTAIRNNAFRNLHRLLRDCIPNRRIDVVAVTGDITTHGKPKGFGAFQNRTADLLLRLLPHPRALCVVPGNHDVQWRLDPTASDYFDVKFRNYRELFKKLGATGALVPRGPLRTGSASIAFAGGEPLYVDAHTRLLVLCVNSAIRCGEVNIELQRKLLTPIQDALRQLSDAGKQFPRDAGSRLSRLLKFSLSK